ncbi:MAG: autotransporter outer membrane beta-barrel domain-containing protein [Fusobacteriaceae bacterium]|nr:autotransporter outer membrane beta-barrel domain-containing protein [Fusobacteriaceae bacterium]
MKAGKEKTLRKILWAAALCALPFSLRGSNYDTSLPQRQGRLLTGAAATHIREQAVLREAGLSGKSQSSVYLTVLSEAWTDNQKEDLAANPGEYKTKIKGLRYGSLSNSVKHPRLFLGMDYAYLKSYAAFKNGGNIRVRSHGLNMTIGAQADKWLVFARAAYTRSRENLSGPGSDQRRHIHSFLSGLEAGRYFTLMEKILTLYPHLGVDYEWRRGKQTSLLSREDEKTPGGVAGLGIYAFFTERWSLQGDISAIRAFGSNPLSSGAFDIRLSHHLSPDFSVSLGYEAQFRRKYFEGALSLGVQHRF